MASYTPQQIEQFLREFFDVVGKRQYIGARYVPVFGRKGDSTIEWDNSAPYEPLTIVTYQGNSYTSRTYVPVGVDILDTEYWANTGNYNAQVEQVRAELNTFSRQFNSTVNRIDGDNLRLSGALPTTRFDSSNTVYDALETLGELLPSTEFTADDTVKEYVDLKDARKVNMPEGSPYGSDGQILSTHGDGTTEWINTGTPSAEQVATAVNAWLDAHPEATTSIPDGGVGTVKLADGAVTDAKLSVTGMLPSFNAAMEKALVDNETGIHRLAASNYEYVRGSGVILTNNTSTAAFLVLNNSILRAIYTNNPIRSGNLYTILFANQNGCIIRNMSGSAFWITYDGQNVTQITNLILDSASRSALSQKDFTAIKTATGVYLRTNARTVVITTQSVNDALATSGISETVTPYLGIGCARQAFGLLLPCDFLVDETNTTIKYAGKTGDFLGDSLTAQTFYTDAFSAQYGITVNNYGVSGTTISNSNPNNMFYTRVASMQDDCDFVFILGGTNDWGRSIPLGNYAAASLNNWDTFCSAVYDLFTRIQLRFPNKPVFVATIPMRNWQGGGQASGIDSNANGDSVMEFNDVLRHYADYFGFTVIESFKCGINMQSLSTYASDGLHFNSAGGARFATYCMDQMDVVTPWGGA